LKGKIVVGQSIDGDIQGIKSGLSDANKKIWKSPKMYDIKDMTKKNYQGRDIGLNAAAKKYLKRDIQGGIHSALEDAKVTMEIFKVVKNDYCYSTPRVSDDFLYVLKYF